ncbi:TMEM165/GDT1 family protein [Vibrio sp. SCSIO 43137]|uniref:TMEM165/GDT1 family protein n=1 Tax=Vibrio sp. SCSIO 43137 TaxID=3021011 RepID=UPI00230794A3|nr:TMEM165/GDT1 family protein [Vibrio sp. SCSIO 43137]WCE30330.1 TMEM165/GDT1 family protein [Vibrio sp. SCSIO 43137]
MTLFTELFSSTLPVFAAIFLAEMGDKSQLVCMALASRHKTRPVAFGAIAAFGLLNLFAVTLGSNLSQLVPQQWVTLAAAILFIVFSLHSLFANHEEESAGDLSQPIKKRGILLTTFIMIFLAELGDKTQLAVFTMSSTYSPVSVWIGSTLALTATSLLGIYAGRKWLAKVNIQLLHKISGLFFIGLALVLLSKISFIA